MGMLKNVAMLGIAKRAVQWARTRRTSQAPQGQRARSPRRRRA